MFEVYIDLDGSELRVVHSGGSVQYFNSKNQWHRLDGPAVDWINGYRAWWKNGKHHRLDGPAIERHDGTKTWFVDGKEVEPLFLVAYWLERGRCCWFDETTQELCFSDP